MALLESLRDALEGRGGFTLVAPRGPAPEPPGRTFAEHRGLVVLWPLSNEPRDVWALFRALADGVVPVIMPAEWPAGKLERTRERYAGFGFYAGGAIVPPESPVSADPRVALALLTSGSTGEPKVVATSLENLTHGIDAIHRSQGLADIGSTGVLLPLAYSYALVNQLLWAVRFGRRLVLTVGLKMPSDAFRQLREAEAEMLCLVAHQVRLLLRYRFGATQALAAVKVANFAGAPFPVRSYDGIRTLFPAATLYNNYGCTEAMPRLTAVRVESTSHEVSCVGRPIGDIGLRIAGDGDVGPITFRGSSASLGTLAEDGSLVPHPDWIPSGDQGRLVDGVLHVFGRHDQVIKVFGERYSLIEIEEAVLSPGVEHAMAWLDTDEKGDDRVQVVAGGEAAPNPQALGEAFYARLPRPVWPRRVFWAAAWPLLPNGKTDRQQLKELAASGRLLPIWPGT